MFLVKVTDFKFVKNKKVNVVMWQHNIWCVYVCPVWRGVLQLNAVLDKYSKTCLKRTPCLP